MGLHWAIEKGFGAGTYGGKPLSQSGAKASDSLVLSFVEDKNSILSILFSVKDKNAISLILSFKKIK